MDQTSKQPQPATMHAPFSHAKLSYNCPLQEILGAGAKIGVALDCVDIA